ncbi:lycopene cyclase [Catellatospora sp. TT07R-123]|uniref:lycopene cyclase domain-containing protein n=1 Tax=Catellatospora sp. TT07R-123 TaxID=2733863 RepID=UPI001B131A71|nr:lycopene cyclase domain-containing protein [Catellatospora sp. TT07R-123]GHJ44994.1 lycopene cyclase [Catellatospora sp. TT07R-123]
MSYTVAAALGVLAAVLLDLVLLRTRLLLGVAFWATYPIVLLFQLLSNGVLTGRGVVRYDPAAITGLRVAYAPVEDLLFGFALVLVTLSLWTRAAAVRRPTPPGR